MPKKAQTSTFEGKRVTARGARYLASRTPKLREEAKVALLLRDTKTSEKSTKALRAVHFLKLPFAKALSRKRPEMKVFEDAASVERLCARHDAAFFGIASHSKKRPDNLILGRVFDGAVLDMFEFGVVSAGAPPTKLVGSKPCLVFLGPDWEGNRLKNFFTDLLRGPDVDDVNLAGLDTVVVLAMGDHDDTITITTCRLDLKKATPEEKTKRNDDAPTARLDAVAEPLVLKRRRDHAPALELWKAALKQPKQGPKKRKNISRNELGETLGTVHLGRQDLDALQTRKVKALKIKHTTDDSLQGTQQGPASDDDDES